MTPFLKSAMLAIALILLVSPWSLDVAQIQPANMPGLCLMGNPFPASGPSQCIGLGSGLLFSSGSLNAQSGCPKGTWTTLPLAAGVIKNQGGVFQLAQYQIDCTSRVWLRGVVTCVNTGTITSGTTLFTMPTGFIPPLDTRENSTTLPDVAMTLNICGITTGCVAGPGAVAFTLDWACTSGISFTSFEGINWSTY